MNTKAFVVLLLTLALGAQQPAPQQQPAAPNSDGVVKFSANATLVVEIVSVKDKSGATVKGLTAKDFTITENGKPQTIAFCDYQELDETPSITPTNAPAPSTATKVAEAAKPAVDSVTKNQIAAEAPGDIRYRDRRLIALYFDMSAMPQADQLRALTAAQKFVNNQMAKPDLVAIMEFEGGAVKVKQDFTGDKDALNMALTKLIIGESQDIAGAAGDDSDADVGSAFGQDDSEFNIFTTDRQLSALQTAVKMLGQLNEQKSLIYFASGLRLNGTDNQAQMRSTTNSAIRSNTKIYSVDARGLVATPPLGDASQGSQGGAAMYSGASAMAGANNFQKSQDTLYALATDTGGKALLDNNDLAMGIQLAQKASSSYYIIGYYTNNTTLDGKFRKISISLKENTANAKLDYRVGYYAGNVWAKLGTADKERQLEDALLLGDPITELTIASEVNYFQLNRAEYFVPVMVKIPGSELVLARHSGAEHTRVFFILEVKDEFNMTVQNVRDKMDIKLSNTTAEMLAKSPIQYDTGFTLLPGTYSMKILARDDETGRIGTFMNKFTIPNLNKEDKRIPISSVVLSGQRVALKDAIYTAGKEVKAPEANPLIIDGAKLIPMVTRVFSKSRDMYIYLQAYEPTAEKTQPLVAFVSFYRGQTKAFETPPLPVAEGMANKLKTMPLRFSLALDKLPAGKYTCQVTVLDPASQKAAFWQRDIVLVP